MFGTIAGRPLRPSSRTWLRSMSPVRSGGAVARRQKAPPRA